MAMTKCRECEGPISTEAQTCPHCGAARLRGRRSRTWGFEWRTRATFLGLPLVHVAVGRDGDGRLRVAKGILAIGQFAVGLITIAQFGLGLLFGFGQFMLGYAVVAQFAGAASLAVGQFAAAHTAVGQFVVAVYGLGQAGLAQHLWSTSVRDPEAVIHFQELWDSLSSLFS